MIPIIVDSIDDKRVDLYKNIKSTRSLLLKENLTICESEILLEQALLTNTKIKSIILSQDYYESYQTRLPQKAEVLIASPELIRNLAKYNLRNPILFITECSYHDIMENLESEVFIYLNGIINFENVGAILRNATAFGFENIIYDNKSCNPFHHRSVVVSRGSVFHSRVFNDSTLNAMLLRKLQSIGYQIISFEISDTSIPVSQISETLESNRKYVIVFGSEGQGIDKEILDISDIVTHIPMNRAINSINVAASSAIGLHLLRESIDLL